MTSRKSYKSLPVKKNESHFWSTITEEKSLPVESKRKKSLLVNKNRKKSPPEKVLKSIPDKKREM